MDKNTIKKYAVWARRELISRVSQRAAYFEITEAGFGDPAADSVLGRVLSTEEKAQRQALISQIRQKGYQQVMEEVAYTWFNRFIALRFMEVNGYLPSHVRVFTDEANQFKPQILAEAINMELDGLDMQKVYACKNANDDDGLFKYMVIVQCNALSAILPGMFQRIADYTELLFPDNLLREGSVLQQMIELIPEEDWKDAVQIIGWLYQYYNAEKKDEVFAALKKNVKITKENIPAATQLFTPDWIVRYMVENSLGRLWVEGHPDTKTRFLPTEEEQSAYATGNRVPEDIKWYYYLEEAQQEPEVHVQLAEIRKEYAAMTPEQIKCIDPCCGSGHILAYLFDVLMQIYESYGYTTREAVASIVQNNLYGLDIDDRAAQLAYFAVMMKARQYDWRFFSRGIQPHVYAIQESNGVDLYALEYFYNGDAKLKAAIDSIITEMHDAKEYGSILNVTPVDFAALYARFDEMRDEINMSKESALNNLLPLVHCAEVLAQKYDVTVTNPPYRGTKDICTALSNFAKKSYPDSKGDLSTIFMERCAHFAKQHGHIAMINIPIWMNKSTFTKLRFKLLHQVTIYNLLDFDRGVFGSDFGTVAFILRKGILHDYIGTYLSLFRERGQVDNIDVKESFFFSPKGKYITKQAALLKIPSYQIAYSYSAAMLNAIANFKPCSFYSDVKSGLQTGNNDLFLRLWFEVSINKIGFGITSVSDGNYPIYKWFPHTKGGSYRKWYGNYEYVLNWQHEGSAIKNYDGFGIAKNPEYYFEECLTWSHTSMRGFSVRYVPTGFIFNVEAPSAFRCKNNYALLGCLNSKISDYYFNASGSGLHYLAGAVAQFPTVLPDNLEISTLVKSNVLISEDDWDSFETSWDFKRHPLLNYGVSIYSGLGNGANPPTSYFGVDQNTITYRIYEKNAPKVYTLQSAFEMWVTACNNRFYQLKANEEDLNRIFIDIYGLQDELTPEVADKDVTVHYLVDTKDDIPASLQGSNYVLTRRDAVVSLISYTVGCMFGRYSLDAEGLAYASGAWDGNKYTTFQADKDNIIPICDDEYFDDDIVGRFAKFIETVYGSDTLEENLKFVADALGGKGTPRDVIRSYFLGDFYADHCKTYQKRPIYWLFDSGKKNGFKALIYMHRYQPDIIARIRTDYVHEQQSRYRTAIADLESRIAAASTAERVKLNKQLKKLQEQDAELRTYEEKIHHLADQMISIDLDDGVKINYAKFQDVLAQIK